MEETTSQIEVDEESNQLIVAEDFRPDLEQPGPSGRLSSTPKRMASKIRNKRKSSEETPVSHSKRSKALMPTEMEQEVAQAEREDIDLFLEDTAERNNLTVANVKSILHRIVTNEHMVALWKNSMSDESTKELPFEPKITRAKLRELKAKHPDIEESLMQRYPQPMSSKATDLLKLLTEDIGDEDDENEDEEYRPSEDDISDDDSEASNSVLNGSMPSSPTVNWTPGSPAPATPEGDHETEETIALRTRSKLPLTAEALEQLEANFIAPDITADMYDTDCDDEEWNQFLRELMQPRISVIREEEDADEEDPPYNVLEDNEEIDELDLRYDRGTKISRMELNELVSELQEIPTGVGAMKAMEETDDEEIHSSRIPAPPLFNASVETPKQHLNFDSTPTLPGTSSAPVAVAASDIPITPEVPKTTTMTPVETPVQTNKASVSFAANPVVDNVAVQQSLESSSVQAAQKLDLNPTTPLRAPTSGEGISPISCFLKKMSQGSSSPQTDMLGFAFSMALNSPKRVNTPTVVTSQLNRPQEIIIQNPPVISVNSQNEPIFINAIVSAPQSGEVTGNVSSGLRSACLPEQDVAIEMFVKEGIYYQMPVEVNKPTSEPDSSQYEVSDALLKIIADIQQRFKETAIRENSEGVSSVGFDGKLIERFREQVKMYVQLTTQLSMLSFAHPQLKTYGQQNQQALDNLNLLAKVQNNPLFAPFNLEPGIAMIEKVKAQLDENGVHPEYEKMSPTLDQAEMNRRKKPMVLKPIPMSVKKLIAWSNVFCFPELLPKAQLITDFEDRSVKTAPCKAEDHLIALGLECFFPEILQHCPIRIGQLIHKHLAPLRRPTQITERTRRLLDHKLEPSANPVAYFRVYRRCPPVEWKARRLMLTPVEQPSYTVPSWVRAIKQGKTSKEVIYQLRRSHTQPILPAHAGIASSQNREQQQLQTSSPAQVRIRASPVKKIIQPILKKYKFLPKPNAVSMSSGANRPALSSTPLSKSRKEALIRLMQKEKEMPEVITVSNSFPEPADLIAIEKPQSPTSTTEDRNREAAPSTSGIAGVFSDLLEIPTPEATNEQQNEDTNKKVDESVATEVQEQLDALMAASSKITRNPKCPRKHRQILKDLETTLPLLDGDKLLDNDERENQFIASYVTKARKFLDQEKIHEMISILKNYKSNIKQLFRKMDDTLTTCPSLVEDLVLFLDSEQAFLADRFQQHLLISKIRLFIRKTEIHAGSSQLAQKLLKVLRNCLKQSAQNDKPQSDEQLASTMVAAITPLLRGQPHLLQEFLALIPNQRVEKSRMTDFDEIVLPEEGPPADLEQIQSFETIRLPPSPEPVGGRKCPCNCHKSEDTKMANRDRHCLQCALRFIDGKVFLQTGKTARPAMVTYIDEEEQPPSHEKAASTHEGFVETATEYANDKAQQQELENPPENFWTRDKDAILLSLYQKHKGDCGDCCTEASQELGIAPSAAQKRLDFLRSYL